MKTNKEYYVDVQGPVDVSQVLKDWQTLSELSQLTCFQSVNWLRAWLECYKPDIKVLRVFRGEALFGMTLIVYVKGKTSLGLPSNRLYFQQVGDKERDQIWVEYNGILSRSGYEYEVLDIACEYLKEIDSEWDELCLGTVSFSYMEAIQARLDLEPMVFSHSPSYGVDIKKLGGKGGNYLDSLSRNTRYQIRRSIKLYESSGGALEVHRALTSVEAQQYFVEVGELHKKRWGAESGFYNEHFIRFHKLLISNSYDDGFVDILKIACGNKVLGYLYNFCFRGIVYFYLCGLTDEGSNKLKPGLTAHTLAIEHYRKGGMSYYDFMGGGGQYKESLGQAHDDLVYASLRKNKYKFRLESKLRQLKERILS